MSRRHSPPRLALNHRAAVAPSRRSAQKNSRNDRHNLLYPRVSDNVVHVCVCEVRWLVI
ncbi:hypothetical protein COLO4_10327 [Corchorus olitorius]|uniref:Uncharacterized protein n=1 Tax=Corchorus olitorius TaxID=93759 RepID=A0A1R3K907_9ROSI|nr:hypothetical protein COLO4_10327 [Corchorus olitorius]